MAIYHRNPNTNALEQTCSGTLISIKHVLTISQCVLNHTTGRPFPENTLEVHFGWSHLDQRSVNEQTRYVSEVHVHTKHSVNDMAILVTSWPVRITPYVTHSCFLRDSYNPTSVERNVFFTGFPNDGFQLQNIRILDRQECSTVGVSVHPNQCCFSCPEGFSASGLAEKSSIPVPE